MIINFREKKDSEWFGAKVLVDGIEIWQAWFVDTDAGVVKTYDVLGDKRAINIRADEDIAALKAADPSLEELGCGLLSRTITGAVQLFRPDGSQAYPQ